MICKKCKNEIPEGSTFCLKCGAKILKENNKKINKIIKKILLLLLIIMVLVILGIFMHSKIEREKKIDTFQKLIDNAEYTKAADYYSKNAEINFTKKADLVVENAYEESIKNGDEELEIAIYNSNLLNKDYISKLDNSILEKIENTKKQYFNENIKYEDALEQVKKYKKYADNDISQAASNSISNIETIHESRQAYESGMAEAEAGDYESALKDLSSVTNQDSNFINAKDKITEIIPQYKEIVLSEVDEKIASNDYDSAISELQILQAYCFDQDVEEKLAEVQGQKTAYDNEMAKAEIQTYEDNQEVEVLSTKVRDVGYTITFMKAEVDIKNNSDKVAKDVNFSLLLFDDDGYPVDVEYDYYKGRYDNEFMCSHESCNVEPGESYGSNWEFSVPDKCKQVKACVTDVKYTDGSTWKNPYYDYWIEDNYSMY